MRVPNDVREEIKGLLWSQADDLDWGALAASEKTKYYTMWTESEQIGARLSVHMDPRKVRVYIKDSLLKGYGKAKLGNLQEKVLRIVERSPNDISIEFEKPHGLRFADGTMVTWGRADDWKILLGTDFERSSTNLETTRQVIFFNCAPRFLRASSREVVESAARLLGVSKIVWAD